MWPPSMSLKEHIAEVYVGVTTGCSHSSGPTHFKAKSREFWVTK